MFEDKYVTVDGLKTRYIEAGQGAPAILIHGAALGTSADTCWGGIMERIGSKGSRLIALDLPGYGLTDNPADNSNGYRRQFILRFMDALGLNKAAIVGHSLGGVFAMQTAFDHPDRVDRIMVLGTGPLLPPLEGSTAPAGGGGERVTTEPTLEESRAALEATTFDHAVLTPQLVQRRHELSLGKNFQAALARQGAGGGEPPVSPPFWQRLDKVPVPARFIYGKQDRGDAGPRAEIARQKYPNLDLHVFDGAKHNVMWDKAGEVAALMDEFLPAKARMAA